MYEIAVRENNLLPAVIEPVVVKTPWWKSKKIVTVKLEDYFEYESNKMIVYKITPHANVSGNNKRLWRSIHKMYEMYDGIRSRLDRKGVKFHYREKDYFWFDVIFRQVNGKKKIEFYVSTSEYQAGKLKRRIENQMNVTLEQVAIESVQIPEEDTIVQNLKYLRHDIFSLNTNANERQTPLASILNTTEELQYDGDIARLSIFNESEPREKWVKNAVWAREKLSKGKVPQRTNASPKKAIPLIKNGMAGLVNEVNGLVTDAFEAIQNSFFKSDKKFEKEKIIEKGYTLEDEINASKLSPASLEKVNLPVFKTHIRVATHSKDRLTRETLNETLSLSLNETADNNELNGHKYRRPKEIITELNTLKPSKKTRLDVDVNLMSTDEMSKLALQMPSRELQIKYADEMNTKRHVETSIPSALQKRTNLLMGNAEVKDQRISVGLQAAEKDEFYSGYTFIGKQGSGKDTAIQNFVYEGAMKQGISFIVPDWICEQGHRGMADGIRDMLPPEKIIDIDLSNDEYIVPMDLTEIVRKLGRKGGSRFALEMMDFLNLSDLPRSQKFLMEASKASGGSLYDIKRIIEDEEFRLNRIEQLIEEGNIRSANDLIAWGTNSKMGDKCDAILSRLNMFFGDDTLNDVFSQAPLPDVDFEKWMKEGKTIIIRMPKRVLGRASSVLAHWVTLKVLMTRFLMSEADKEKHGCFILFNEPEQVESKGLAELMGRIATEGRKERLGSIFAFHHWDKLPRYLQDNLQAGGVNQFLFASDHKKTFEVVKERLHPTFTIDDALQTPKYHSIAILNGREPYPPFLMEMLPPIPKKLRYDNSFLTKRHARMYGRHWKELQQAQ